MKNFRKTIYATISENNGVSMIHFHGVYKLSGGKNTLNFPIYKSMEIHVQVESIMLANKMCTNVTRVHQLNTCSFETELEITYNLPR